MRPEMLLVLCMCSLESIKTEHTEQNVMHTVVKPFNYELDAELSCTASTYLMCLSFNLSADAP